MSATAETPATPNHTLYLNNLNEKVKKEVLKKSIYSVFSQFGKIVDIVCCRGIRLRGQAWIVFSDMASATNALRQMQGFPFYDKPMRISFAKTESDVITKAKGTFVPREKRPRQQPEVPAQQPKLIAEAPRPPKKQNTNPPSNVLFAQELPDECTDSMLTLLFQQYTGFKEVRMVPGKKGIAFIEFADDVQASLALQSLENYKLTPTQTLNLTFAKR